MTKEDSGNESALLIRLIFYLGLCDVEKKNYHDFLICFSISILITILNLLLNNYWINVSIKAVVW